MAPRIVRFRIVAPRKLQPAVLLRAAGAFRPTEKKRAASVGCCVLADAGETRENR